MQAKKKPVAKKPIDAFGIDTAAHLEILKMAEPPTRKGGVKVKTVQELVQKLKTEAGVL